MSQLEIRWDRVCTELYVALLELTPDYETYCDMERWWMGPVKGPAQHQPDNEETAKKLAGWLNDGLHYGNWPWVTGALNK